MIVICTNLTKNPVWYILKVEKTINLHKYILYPMSPIINRRTVLTLILLLFAASQLTLSAKKRENFKNWNEGPLTWADYQQVELSPLATNTSQSAFKLNAVKKKTFIQNYKLVYYQVDCTLNRDRSYYDPSRADDLDLRANQAIFDTWELYARYIQSRAIGETTPAYSKVIDDYMVKADKEIAKFQQESNQFRDEAVISKYEESVRSQLEKTKRKEPDLSVTQVPAYRYGFYIGAEHESLLGTAKEKVNDMFGFNIGIDYITKKQWYIDFGMTGYFTELKTNNFYHDIGYDYDWVTDKTVNHFRMYLNVGHIFDLNQYFRLIPYAGIGYADISQQSDKINPDSQDRSYYSSSLGSFSVQAGVNADWMIRRNISPDDITDTSLRFKLYGAYEDWGLGYKTWSVNVGLVFNLDTYSFLQGIFIPIPIFI